MSSPAEQPPRASLSLLDARIRRAVEGVAETDPNPLDPFRGLYVSDDAALSLARGGGVPAVDRRLREASELLGLGSLDEAVLGLCALPELSPRYGRLVAYLHDDVTRKLASPRLVARLLAGGEVSVETVLRCFEAEAPLRRLGALELLDADRVVPLAERPVKLADRLASRLLGGELADRPRDGSLRLHPPPAYDPGRPDVLRRLRSLVASAGRLPVVVAGPDAASLLAAALERPLLLVDVAHAGDAARMREAVLAVTLERAVLCFERLEALEPGARSHALRALAARDGPVLICAATRDVAAALGDATAIVVEAPLPTLAERRSAWAALAGPAEVEDVASKFRLSIDQIAAATDVAQLNAATRGAAAPEPADLDLGARQASSTRLGELAARLERRHGWDELVLPQRQQAVLRSISGYLRHRDLVLSEWGYAGSVARDQGLKVLFAGESGTGKTMAGQVLANDLGLELFRIDLATVVSKYIGETEKNLDRIFAAAEGSNAILFFDEADALFGKRSEVRDSHDRYANIEVAYLLQKMEAYSGAVILATNLRQNIDDAFLRRLDFVVDFPFPEADDRERIWRLLLPPAAPVAPDVDVPFLARQFKLSGGGIRNASLAAAFAAADDGGTISMRHLVRAVALEYDKLGRLTLESDFERFHGLVRD